MRTWRGISAFVIGAYLVGQSFQIYSNWIDEQMPDELFAVQRADGVVYLPPGHYKSEFWCRDYAGTILACALDGMPTLDLSEVHMTGTTSGIGIDCDRSDVCATLGVRQ